MSIWTRLKGFLGGRQPSDNGVYLYVRCNRCRDKVRVRLNPTSDLQQEFGGAGDAVGGYSVRKMVVDQRCFRPIEIRMQFDAGRRERSREIDGGTFLTPDEFNGLE